MTIMRKPLRVSVCKVCRVGALKDGRMGISQARADRIKAVLRYATLS